MMMKIMRKMSRYFMILLVILIFCTGCSKDQDYINGRYRYADNHLEYLGEPENVNGFDVLWSPNVSSEQKVVIKKILANMVYIPDGQFCMGAQSDNSSASNYNQEARADESPVHWVSITRLDYLCKYEITQKEWVAIMGTDSVSSLWSADFGIGDDFPAYFVSYNDFQRFVEKLNLLCGLTFRMPTEAEWEYAARGANNSHSYIYSGGNTIENVAWYDANAGNHVHEVGKLSANEKGVYDMSGNVWEWCADSYMPYTNSNSIQYDPLVNSETTYEKVLRGGSWCYIAEYCRVSCRDHYDKDLRSVSNGGRLALTY